MFSTPEKESILDAQSPSELKRKTDQHSEKQDQSKSNADSNILSDDNTHAKIKHVSGDLNADDLYALPNKRSTIKSADKNESKVYEVASDEEEKDECDNKNAESESIEDKDANKDLPFGWEKHEDNDGPYYWHIKSGTIQREPPLFPKEMQSADIKTPSTGLNQSPSLLHLQATSSLTKFGPHSQYHNVGMGFNVRTQVCASACIFYKDIFFFFLAGLVILVTFRNCILNHINMFACTGNTKLISHTK